MLRGELCRRGSPLPLIPRPYDTTSFTHHRKSQGDYHHGCAVIGTSTRHAYSKTRFQHVVELLQGMEPFKGERRVSKL